MEHVEGKEILWFRKAFKNEWDGATMVRSSSRRIYSRESVDDLTAKFQVADPRSMEEPAVARGMLGLDD